MLVCIQLVLSTVYPAFTHTGLPFTVPTAMELLTKATVGPPPPPPPPPPPSHYQPLPELDDDEINKMLDNLL